MASPPTPPKISLSRNKPTETISSLEKSTVWQLVDAKENKEPQSWLTNGCCRLSLIFQKLLFQCYYCMLRMFRQIPGLSSVMVYSTAGKPWYEWWYWPTLSNILAAPHVSPFRFWTLLLRFLAVWNRDRYRAARLQFRQVSANSAKAQQTRPWYDGWSWADWWSVNDGYPLVTGHWWFRNGNSCLNNW